LYAESRLGELLNKVSNPTASRQGRRQLPEGISDKESHELQKISRHRELIPEIVAAARESGTVPLKSRVLTENDLLCFLFVSDDFLWTIFFRMPDSPFIRYP
jgi:hypothetical protein